jgi:enterochelin esterase-like enzyme
VTHGLVVALVSLAIWLLPRSAGAGSVQGQLHRQVIHSEIFGSDRQILVWLPPHYEDAPQQRFPLLLAFQGENLFDAAAAAGGDEWAVDELLWRSPAGIPAFIVVGLVSAPNAIREYSTPGARSDAQADLLLQHALTEVLPFVESRWRVDEDFAARYLMGMGMSALTAIYGAWQHADAFAGALAFDLPDVDATSLSWVDRPPAGGRPWFWVEQRSAERSRQSNSGLFTALQRHSDVTFMVAGEKASRPARLAAALRGTPLARWQRQQAESPAVSSPE